MVTERPPKRPPFPPPSGLGQNVHDRGGAAHTPSACNMSGSRDARAARGASLLPCLLPGRQRAMVPRRKRASGRSLSGASCPLQKLSGPMASYPALVPGSSVDAQQNAPHPTPGCVSAVRRSPLPPHPPTRRGSSMAHIDTMHVVHPRAAGLDVHKMQITATVRLACRNTDAEMFTRVFSALPSGLEHWPAGCSTTGSPPRHGSNRDLLGGRLHGARRCGHGSATRPCPACQADQGSQDRCGRQHMAGAYLPVRPLQAQVWCHPATSAPCARSRAYAAR